jgi:hypothetical protein
MLALIIKGELHGSALPFIGLWGLPVELPPTIAFVLQSRRASGKLLYYSTRGVTIERGAVYTVGSDAFEACGVRDRLAILIRDSPLDRDRLAGISLIHDRSVFYRAEETIEGILLEGRGEFLDAVEGVGNIDIPF